MTPWDELPNLDALLSQVVEMATDRAVAGAAPFAALIVDGTGSVVGKGVNRVVDHTDPTAHAEMEALRDAAGALRRTSLHGHAVIASGEPCAMCAVALRSAGLERVYYAMTRNEAAQAGYDYRASYDVVREDALGRDLPSRHRPAPESEAMLARWPERPVTF